MFEKLDLCGSLYRDSLKHITRCGYSAYTGIIILAGEGDTKFQ